MSRNGYKVQYATQGELQVQVATVVHAVEAILQAGKRDDFLAECAKLTSRVTVPAELVNFVKDYLADMPDPVNLFAARVGMHDKVRQMVESDPPCD